MTRRLSKPRREKEWTMYAVIGNVGGGIVRPYKLSYMSSALVMDMKLGERVERVHIKVLRPLRGKR